MIRLAMIGCGNIAEFHVPAMIAAGFEIVAVAGTLNSNRAKDFAKRHGIKSCYADPEELLQDSDEWDALLLLTPTEDMVKYILMSGPIGKPVLAEKPVALDHHDLTPLLKFNNVLVAYNRRFYASVEYANNFLISHPKALVKVSIPEKRLDPDHNFNFPHRLPLLSYENSVHVYDLLNYLVGNVQWSAVSKISEDDKYLAVAALGKGERGAVVQLDTCFNSPDNFAINIISQDERVELRPIEIARYYRGMSVNEPNESTPIRTYSPKMVEQVVSGNGGELKPGLLGQAKDFYAFCSGASDSGCASLEDAYNALKLADSLTKFK